MRADKLIRYSVQLAFLRQLLECGLISEKEYSIIKNRLMRDYNIKSDLTAWNTLKCIINTIIGIHFGGAADGTEC